MADDPKTQLLPLLVLTLVLGGAYAGLKYFGGPDEAPAATGDRAASSETGGSAGTSARGASADALAARRAAAQTAQIETEHFIATFTTLTQLPHWRTR